MKEPSPEDMSYLSDHNIEWCAEYYILELCKRAKESGETYDLAFKLWDKFGSLIDDAEPKTFRPVAHRHSA